MMTQHWRLLLHGARNAFDNMAIDEAILRTVAVGDAPGTLRFYTWEPSAVSIGYFQGVEQEVDLEACRREGVDVIRRITGGGAVCDSASVFRDDEIIQKNGKIKITAPRISTRYRNTLPTTCITGECFFRLGNIWSDTTIGGLGM